MNESISARLRVLVVDDDPAVRDVLQEVLMQREYSVSTAEDGAAAIHDIEIARMGRTSEDVEAHLQAGTFGMVDETGTFMNAVATRAAREQLGLGEAWGAALESERAPHRDVSLLARAARRGVPATVHVALGTDTIHYDPTCDGAALGEASLRDFRILSHALQFGEILVRLSNRVNL